MNIYALNGHKVKCETLEAGYNSDKETAKEYLEVGKEYTIERTEVSSWSTDVLLKEFPDVVFNSAFFEDVVEQSEEMDKQHNDYKRYNP